MIDPSAIVITLEGEPGSDGDDLARMASSLRQELLQLEIEDATQLRGSEVPEGARAVGAETVGALLVKLGPAAARKVVQVVQRWLSRSKARSAEINWQGNSVKVTGISAEVQEQLITTWLSLVEKAVAQPEEET